MRFTVVVCDILMMLATVKPPIKDPLRKGQPLIKDTS